MHQTSTLAVTKHDASRAEPFALLSCLGQCTTATVGALHATPRMRHPPCDTSVSIYRYTQSHAKTTRSLASTSPPPHHTAAHQHHAAPPRTHRPHTDMGQGRPSSHAPPAPLAPPGPTAAPRSVTRSAPSAPLTRQRSHAAAASTSTSHDHTPANLPAQQEAVQLPAHTSYVPAVPQPPGIGQRRIPADGAAGAG